MIIVTGGAGFIGSAIIWKLNTMGVKDILAVDNLASSSKWTNLRGLSFFDYMERDSFIELIKNGAFKNDRIDCVIHMGACSSTTEADCRYLLHNNYEYTKTLAWFCADNGIRFIYASSAATYGAGENGFSDDDCVMEKLRPLNMYGYSKQLFDLYAKSNGLLDKIVGLKFFNVFGPNEYHKKDMRSLVNKAYHQIKETGSINLFKSHVPEYEHGEQLRDFIYVKQAVERVMYFVEHRDRNGIFNIGSAKANSWNQLAKAIFKALKMKAKINYIDMPVEIRDKYQYYTKADMSKFEAASAGADLKSFTLEEAVKDYVLNYLEKGEKRLSALDE
jgi:ADP-L-glycero-D-manno-heptose 6-epimerase